MRRRSQLRDISFRDYLQRDKSTACTAGDPADKGDVMRILQRAVVCVAALGMTMFAGCGSRATRDVAASRPTAASNTSGADSAANSPGNTFGILGSPGTSAAAVGTDSRTPKASAETAVLALLTAERDGKHRVSFGMLARGGLDRFSSPESWTRHRVAAPGITGFRLESQRGSEVTILVEHEPGIDPFVGLRFAQERQVWRAVQETDGWLVDPVPAVTPVVPSGSGIVDVVRRWTLARQACDANAELRLQAVPAAFGLSATAASLCRTTGAVSLSKVVPVVPGPDTAPLVEQYGPGVLRYVRSVEVSGPSGRFTVIVVPIGDTWRILSVTD